MLRPMPVTWTIDHDKKFVTAVAHGALVAEDVRNYLQQVAAAGGMPYRKIFDASVADLQLTLNDLQGLGSSIREFALQGLGPIGPLAIVAPAGDTRMQAAWFADAAASPRPIRIFQDRADAARWLASFASS